MKFDVGLRYDTPRESIVAFKDQVREYLDNREAFSARGREVRFTGFGDSALNIMILGYLTVPGWGDEMDEKEALFLEIMRIAEELSVGFAYPSTSVYLENMPVRAQS